MKIMSVFDGQTGEFLYMDEFVDKTQTIEELKKGNAVELYETNPIQYEDDEMIVDEDGFASLKNK